MAGAVSGVDSRERPLPWACSGPSLAEPVGLPSTVCVPTKPRHRAWGQPLGSGATARPWPAADDLARPEPAETLPRHCGTKTKKPLSQRDHACENCGANGDRDLVSAAVGTCVVFTDATDPRTARVDPELASRFGDWLAAQQEALTRSTSTAEPTHVGTGSVGSHAVAAAGYEDPDRPTPDTATPAVTSPAQAEPAPSMSHHHLRLIS